MRDVEAMWDMVPLTSSLKYTLSMLDRTVRGRLFTHSVLPTLPILKLQDALDTGHDGAAGNMRLTPTCVAQSVLNRPHLNKLALGSAD